MPTRRLLAVPLVVALASCGSSPSPAADAPGDEQRFVSITSGLSMTTAQEADTHLRIVDLVVHAEDFSYSTEGMLDEGLSVGTVGTLALDDGVLLTGSRRQAGDGAFYGDDRPELRVSDGPLQAPVTLAVLPDVAEGQPRVAFAEVSVDAADPVRWEPAPQLDVDTDDGLAALWPKREGLTPGPRPAGTPPEDEFAVPGADMLSACGCAGVSIGPAQWFVLALGPGPGRYPAYLGRAADGRLVSVVLDGGLLPWADSGLPGAPPAGAGR